jgi:DNA uptake protein ComE-like DNA-binding protein
MTRTSLLIAFFAFAVAGCADAGDSADADSDTDAPAVDTAMAPAGADTAMATAPATGDLLDPSDATREELLAVEGMDEAVADALMAGRPYADMTAVDAVLAEHMDESAREELYRHVWMPLDLNAASEEEILLIPGVGDRMLHEFQEYRPYRGIEEFRREIGKYVDDEEVARLERYVMVR